MYEKQEYSCAHCKAKLKEWEIYFPPFKLILDFLDKQGICLSQVAPERWMEVMIYLGHQFAFCEECFKPFRYRNFRDETYDDIVGKLQRWLKFPADRMPYDGYLSQTNPATDVVLRAIRDQQEQQYYRRQLLAHNGQRLRAA